MTLRFHLPPGGDVPPVTAARRLGLSLEAFREALPALLKSGFPPPRETTGNFDLDAIEAWRRLDSRKACPHLFPAPLTPTPAARDAKDIPLSERLARLHVG